MAINNVEVAMKNLLIIYTIIMISSSAFSVEIMLDHDYSDHLSSPHLYEDAVIYDEQVFKEFFGNCKKHGVSKVFLRVYHNFACYPSELNYDLTELREIISSPTAARRNGAFAAKVGFAAHDGLTEGGITQRVDTVSGEEYTLSAWISSPEDMKTSLVVVDTNSNEVLFRSEPVSWTGIALVPAELTFTAPGPVKVGAYTSKADRSLASFVIDDISVKDQQGNELVKNGTMEEVYKLVPVGWDWQTANYLVLNGDCSRQSPDQAKKSFPNGLFYSTPSALIEIARLHATAGRAYNAMEAGVKAAKENSVKLYAWYDPVDDAMRQAPLPVYSLWLASKFAENNPQFQIRNKNGERRFGVMCFGYPEVQEYKTAVVKELLAYDPGGIYLKFSWTHTWPNDNCLSNYNFDGYLYNDIAINDYHELYGKPSDGNYDEIKLKEIYGEYVLDWLSQVRHLVHSKGKKLSIGVLPTDYFQEFAGGWKLNWDRIFKEKLVDEIVLEPRDSGNDQLEYLKAIDRYYQFAQRCRDAGIRFSYDLHINNIRRSEPNMAEWLTKQLTDLAKAPVDMIGIYEALHVDGDDLWPSIEKAVKQIQQMNKAEKIEPADINDTQPPGNNIALSSYGTKATLERSGSYEDASVLIDGNIHNSSNKYFKSPAVIEIELQEPEVINQCRIYSGYLMGHGENYVYNHLKSYKLQGEINGHWVEVIQPVENAPSAKEMNARIDAQYFYSHKLNTAQPLKKIRLLIDDPADSMIYIREIQLFTD
jgi:hypothetical protein